MVGPGARSSDAGCFREATWLFSPGEWRIAFGLPCCERVKKISCGKQCQTKHSTCEIEVMTYTVFQPPMHPMKDAECFAYVGKDHDYKKC